VISRGSSLASHIVSTLAILLADSFRDAYARTGMNLTQAIVLVAVDL